MEKQFSWIFLGVSVAFFLFITGLTGYRIDTARRTNVAAARTTAMNLAAQADSLRAGPLAFADPSFKAGMKERFDAESRLLLAAVRSDADGILWLVARNRRFLRDPVEVTPDWRGMPSYQANRGTEALVSRPLRADGGGPIFDGLFVVIGREDLYPILRDDLYLFLTFLLASGIFMLLTTGSTHAGSTPKDDLRGHSLASPSTGLAWAEHLAPRLKAEIERAAAADQDLAFGRVVLDEPPGASGSGRAAAAIAGQLKQSFPIADLVFESGPGVFSVVLPDNDLEQAVRSFEALRARIASTPPPGGPRSVSIGVSARGGRLIEENTLLVEAKIAAGRAARKGGNRVVGFRADPARFRAALGGIGA